MSRATAKQRHEFIGLCYEHSPHEWQPDQPAMFVQRQAEALMRYGATLCRLAEEQCNGYQDHQGNWDERATRQSDAKEARIRQRATDVAASIGGRVVFQGDPRGNTLKVIFPDGYTNDWGHEGICVPTS